MDDNQDEGSEFGLTNVGTMNLQLTGINGDPQNNTGSLQTIEEDFNVCSEEINKAIEVESKESLLVSGGKHKDLEEMNMETDIESEGYSQEQNDNTDKEMASSMDHHFEDLDRSNVCDTHCTKESSDTEISLDNVHKEFVVCLNKEKDNTGTHITTDTETQEELLVVTDENESANCEEQLKHVEGCNEDNITSKSVLAIVTNIADQEPVEESKESLLQKLTSRGSISIVPSGVGLPTQSLTVVPALLKPKIAAKSVMVKQQKCKKIEIDPGNSMDIDKDFDSLISALSAGNNLEEKHCKLTPTETVQDMAMVQSNLDVLDEVLNTTETSTEQSKDVLNGVEEGTVKHLEETKGDQSLNISEDNQEIIPIPSPQSKNVEEGSAEILMNSKSVFYNKVQEFNRDMSIAALTVFSEMHQQDPRTRNRGRKRKTIDPNESDSSSTNEDDVFEPGKRAENGITILEALSASGLRSIRYAREIPGVKQIIANDLSNDAVESIKKNIEHNKVGDLVTTSKSDASFLMYQQLPEQKWYDAIDLDPYGCPSRFLDSAVQVARDGGLLLVTCTDMAILAGNSPESCYAKYGAVSIRNPACHEMAIRIALQCIEAHANRYGRYIVPLLSFSADFYIRVVVQIYTSPVTCKKTASKLSMVYQCTGCQTLNFQPLGVVTQEMGNTQPKFTLPHTPPVNTNCFHCQHKHHMAGPIWTAPTYNTKFIESMLRVVEKGRFGTTKRMQGMLEVIREELPDVPLYYTISGLCSRLHCQAIPLIDIKSAVLNAGYRVSSSHAAPTAIKTNAPSKVIWDIMRCWVHMNPVSEKRMVPGSVLAAIILEPPSLIANFDIHPKARSSSSMRKLLRYQPNPEKNWGPGTRARCNILEDDPDGKRRLNQHKNTNKNPKKTVSIIEVVTIDDDEVSEETMFAEDCVASAST